MSSSKSQTQANQTTHQTDNRVAADGGSIVAGTGSTVQIENLSDDVAVAAIKASSDTAKDSIELSDRTQDRLADFGTDAIHTVTNAISDQGSGVLSFASQAIASNKDLIEKQLEANNRFARDQSELIAAQAGVVAPTDNARLQNIVIGSLILVALLGVAPLLLKSAPGRK